jgi:hypothetical protein
VFTAELLAREQHSNDASLTADQRKEARTRLQNRVGMPDADYEALKTIATRLHADLEANAKQGDTVLKSVSATATQRASSIAALRDARNAAVDNAVGQWRAYLGARFRWTDDQIRAYVAPGLLISEDSGEVAAGGKQ